MRPRGRATPSFWRKPHIPDPLPSPQPLFSSRIPMAIINSLSIFDVLFVLKKISPFLAILTSNVKPSSWLIIRLHTRGQGACRCSVFVPVFQDHQGCVYNPPCRGRDLPRRGALDSKQQSSFLVCNPGAGRRLPSRRAADSTLDPGVPKLHRPVCICSPEPHLSAPRFIIPRIASAKTGSGSCPDQPDLYMGWLPVPIFHILCVSPSVSLHVRLG